MAISLYMDHHVARAITVGLRLRSVDVLTALEDGTDQLADDALLDRATQLGRALFTQDEDFLAEAAKRQIVGVPFGGIIFAHQMRVAIGTCVNDLELIAKVAEPDELADCVTYLPL